jgi:hypothetical protein
VYCCGLRHPGRPSPDTSAIGERLYAGYPDEFQIDVLTTDGGPMHRIRRTGAQQRLSEAVFERLAEAQIENTPEESRPAARRQILDKPRPEVLPAFTQNILEDAEGNLWVQNFPLPGARMAGWSVFDSGGAYLGDVPVPAAFTPYEIASGKMLGIWKDSLDVETIRAYRLIKGSNAAPDETSGRRGRTSAAGGIRDE